MSEYLHIIQKEKKDALQDYREDIFRSHLERRVAHDIKAPNSNPYVKWFQKPAVAGISVLFIILLVWLSRQIILPSSQVFDEAHIKNMFVQVFSKNDNILNLRPAADESNSEKSAINEFEWALKRVILAIRRENASDEDMIRNLTAVLQKSAIFARTDRDNSGEFNI